MRNLKKNRRFIMVYLSSYNVESIISVLFGFGIWLDKVMGFVDKLPWN